MFRAAAICVIIPSGENATPGTPESTRSAAIATAVVVFPAPWAPLMTPTPAFPCRGPSSALNT